MVSGGGQNADFVGIRQWRACSPGAPTVINGIALQTAAVRAAGCKRPTINGQCAFRRLGHRMAIGRLTDHGGSEAGAIPPEQKAGGRVFGGRGPQKTVAGQTSSAKTQRMWVGRVKRAAAGGISQQAGPAHPKAGRFCQAASVPARPGAEMEPTTKFQAGRRGASISVAA